MQTGYKLLRKFLDVYPFDYGKGFAYRSAFHLLGLPVVDTRFGMRMRVHPNQVLGRDLFRTGVWEPENTALFNKLLSPGDVVLDVGAHVGYFTLLSSTLVGETGKVLAIEPQSSNRELLLENLALNGVGNVEVLSVGLAGRNGEATLYRGTSGNPGLSSIRPGQNETSERIELRRGEEIVPRDLWERLRLIKLDVEGAELEALRGLAKVLETGRAVNVLVEVTPRYLEQMGDSEAGLLAFFHDRGYARRIITEAPPANEPGQYNAWFARRHENGLWVSRDCGIPG